MINRKKFFRFLAIGLCGAVLAGCSTNKDNAASSTSASEPAEIQSIGNTSSESSLVTSEATSSSEKKDSNENDCELTEEEAKEKLFDYVKENDPSLDKMIDDYVVSMEEQGNNFQASIFPHITSDDEQGGALIARYNIERKTGDVEKVTSEDDDAKPYISEIVDFSEEERRAHHEKLAGGSEHVQNKVYEHLLLPGIHENTKKYEGRVNPGNSIRFTFPDAEEFYKRSVYDPEVSKDGYFTIDLSAYKFEAGQDIEVAITGGYPQEQTFNIPVNEAQEGMEDIRVRE